MTKLKDLLNEFQLNEEERKLITENDNLKNWRKSDQKVQEQQEVPQSFINIARCILDGHFDIIIGRSTVRQVFPTCVEIYYHEEDGNNAIKDYIVYHRNRPNKKFNYSPSLLEKGVFNAHQSGVDITFEHRAMIDGKEVEVRASALIRKFKVVEKRDVFGSKYKVDTVDIKAEKEDGRSTYVYNALLSNLPIFEGFSIQWVDAEDSKKDVEDSKKTLKKKYRQNVKPSTYAPGTDKNNKNSDNTQDENKDGNKIVTDGRYWQFYYE